MSLQWNQEKEAIAGIRELRKQIEETKVAIDKAERAYELNKVAELRYGKLNELETRLKDAETRLAEQGHHASQGRSG